MAPLMRYTLSLSSDSDGTDGDESKRGVTTGRRDPTAWSRLPQSMKTLDLPYPCKFSAAASGDHATPQQEPKPEVPAPTAQGEDLSEEKSSDVHGIPELSTPNRVKMASVSLHQMCLALRRP